MDNNNTVILALIAIIATVIPALFKLLNANTKVIARLSDSMDTQSRESKERNGHLGDQNIELGKQNLQIVKLITEIKTELDKKE